MPSRRRNLGRPWDHAFGGARRRGGPFPSPFLISAGRDGGSHGECSLGLFLLWSPFRAHLSQASGAKAEEYRDNPALRRSGYIGGEDVADVGGTGDEGGCRVVGSGCVLSCRI